MLHWKVTLAFGFINLGYLFLGAGVFHALEGGNEKATFNYTTAIRNQFLDDFGCISEQELNAFVTAVLQAYDQGIIILNGTSPPENWSIRNAGFFASTVLTTIGYGNLSPSTEGGQTFCIFYAIFGIPLMMIFLADIGERITNANKRLSSKINLFKNERLERISDTVMVFVTGAVLMLIIPALIFMGTEGWPFITSLYYCVISLTTIGFGDYVAGQEWSSTWLRMFITLWLIAGLAWMASVIGNLQSVFTAPSEKKLNRSKEKQTTENEKEGKESPGVKGDPENGKQGIKHGKNGNVLFDVEEMNTPL